MAEKYLVLVDDLCGITAKQVADALNGNTNAVFDLDGAVPLADAIRVIALRPDAKFTVATAVQKVEDDDAEEAVA